MLISVGIGETEDVKGCPFPSRIWETAFPTAPIHFRHFSPEVPDSLHIAAYPCISRKRGVLGGRRKGAGNKQVFAALLLLTLVDRTQEVIGSTDPTQPDAR